MKKIITLVVLIFTISSYSQDLPSKPADGYAFSLGTKFTIKMHPTDSLVYDYSIIKFETYPDLVDTFENDNLFDENGEKGTIEFCFCLGTSGETQEEKEENMKVLLLMKNNSEHSFNYISDIQLEEDGKFENTSNVGTFKGARGTEIWPYMIYTIGLKSFKVME